MPANKYYLKSGEEVPGVSKIGNQLDIPQLKDWVWKLGTKKIPWRDELKKAGDIGTLVHEMALQFVRNEPVDVSSCSGIVFKCFDKFTNWWHDNIGIQDWGIIAEQPFVSEKLGFGGQPDIYIEELKRLVDVKTSGGIYDSHWLQLAGYGILLKEAGYPVVEYQILWIPKDNRFSAPVRKDLRKEKQIFKNLLNIYKLRRE